MITDMTEGRPGRILWRFALPILLSVAFQQLYQIADSVIAGRLVGGAALAAIGASYPITMLFMAFATGMNLGCSVVVSQLFGAKDYARMKTSVSTSILTSLTLSVLLTVLGLLFCRGMLTALDTDSHILADAGIYLRIYVAGLVFLFLYNICTGIFTALGDSRTPLYFLIASSVANIILDIVFVTVGGMGVDGVAWATFLAQGVSSILAIITLLRRLKTLPSSKFPLFQLHMFGRITGVAVPSILQQSFISVGNLVVQRLINGYGWAIIGGFSAAMKLNTFTIVALTALGSAVSSFSAQNIGAGKNERVMQGLRASFGMALAVVVPFTLLYTVFAKPMMGLFVDASETEIIAAGVQFLRVVSPFYVVIALKLCADGVLRGAGAMGAFMVATFSDLILRVALSYVFAGWWDVLGIWLSWPVGWAIGTAASVTFVLSGVWKKKKRIE
ncbi:MAG: MATE family efflux transporter [Butyricicoccus sp.]